MDKKQKRQFKGFQRKVRKRYPNAKIQMNTNGKFYISSGVGTVVGEELFMVDWNQATDDVYFRIVVFARPGSMLAWLGKPYMLLQQQKFRRLAGHAIKQATEARYANCTNN